MGRVIAPDCVDDKPAMEHDENMSDGDLILKIEPELAERLRARAKAAGQTVEDYALGILRRAVEEPGFGESETSWNGAPRVRFPQRDVAYWEDIQRICDETDRDGGIPWEQAEARLRNFGKKR